MLKTLFAATILSAAFALPALAQDATNPTPTPTPEVATPMAAPTMCDAATMAEAQKKVEGITETNKDGVELPAANNRDFAAKELAAAQVAMAAGNTEQCLVHLTAIMMNENQAPM